MSPSTSVHENEAGASRSDSRGRSGCCDPGRRRGTRTRRVGRRRRGRGSSLPSRPSPISGYDAKSVARSKQSSGSASTWICSCASSAMADISTCTSRVEALLASGGGPGARAGRELPVTRRPHAGQADGSMGTSTPKGSHAAVAAAIARQTRNSTRNVAPDVTGAEPSRKKRLATATLSPRVLRATAISERVDERTDGDEEEEQRDRDRDTFDRVDTIAAGIAVTANSALAIHPATRIDRPGGGPTWHRRPTGSGHVSSPRPERSPAANGASRSTRWS